MKAWLRAVVLVPVAVVLISFALANRAYVALRLDPFELIDPPLSFNVPLFLPIFIGIIVGIGVGGIAMWFSQGRHRRAVKMHLRTIELQRRQAEEFHRPQEVRPLPPTTLVG